MQSLSYLCSLFFEGYVDHRDLHVLTHSFPTRRSSDLLLPTMTALENVAVPLELAGIADPFGRAAAELEAVGLGHRLTHYPAQMSGGIVRSEEHTSELQSLMRISYAVF